MTHRSLERSGDWRPEPYVRQSMIRYAMRHRKMRAAFRGIADSMKDAVWRQARANLELANENIALRGQIEELRAKLD